VSDQEGREAALIIALRQRCEAQDWKLFQTKATDPEAYLFIQGASADYPRIKELVWHLNASNEDVSVKVGEERFWVEIKRHQGLLHSLDHFVPKLPVKARIRISKAPGHRLAAIAEFFYSAKTWRTVFEPLLTDMNHEYFVALAAGRRGKAWWIHKRYVIAFWQAVGLNAVVQAVASLWTAAKSLP
jgi:hypothetical protein